MKKFDAIRFNAIPMDGGRCWRLCLLACFLSLTIYSVSDAADLEIYTPTSGPSDDAATMTPLTSLQDAMARPDLYPSVETGRPEQQKQNHQPALKLKSDRAIQAVNSDNKPLKLASPQPLSPEALPSLSSFAAPAKTKAESSAQAVSLAASPRIDINADAPMAESSLEPGLQSLEYKPSEYKPSEYKPAESQAQNQNLTASAESAHRKKEKPPKSVVYYTPLPAIAVFPVVKHGNSHMFSDVVNVFAREFALRLEGMAPGTRVLNPFYTLENLKGQGLYRDYQKLVESYLYAGRPDPVTMDYFLKRMSLGSDEPISRVFFVEADLDNNEPMAAKGFGGAVDRIRNVFDGSMPDHMKYYVRGHIQAFDTEDPTMPRIWRFNWHRSLRADRFNNVTPSVYADSDALRVFSENSSFLSKEAMLVLPKAVYMDEHVDTAVQGRLAKDDAAQPASPELQALPSDTAMKPAGYADSGETGVHNTDTTDEKPRLRDATQRPREPLAESGKKLFNRIRN
ncbi:MAG: hypothetical protein VKJ04_11190 [Vampirovibrionales bacterium]|nr:hypothetical protein [Vampirovibrionales bacterium]